MKRCIPFSEVTAEILAAEALCYLLFRPPQQPLRAKPWSPVCETLWLTDAGIQVIGIRDNPRFASDMYMCAMKAKNIDDCSEPVEAKYGEDPAAPIFAK